MFDDDKYRTKKELRESARGLETVKADILTDKFLSLPQLEEAEVIMLYVGMAEESDTIPLIQQLLALGKRVVLPVCLPARQMEIREIHSISDLVAGKFGIREPGKHCCVAEKEEVDIVLTPYVLCDRAGHRLGRGGGYYDRWLSDFKGLKVLISSRERVRESLPAEPHDLPVDVLMIV